MLLQDLGRREVCAVVGLAAFGEGNGDLSQAARSVPVAWDVQKGTQEIAVYLKLSLLRPQENPKQQGAAQGERDIARIVHGPLAGGPIVKAAAVGTEAPVRAMRKQRFSP